MPPAITIPTVPSQLYIHHTTLQPRPKLILIGDSITEQGSASANGWATSLSIRYSRRLDVLNRGMNGYNSRWGLACLPLILEEILGGASESSAGICGGGGAVYDDGIEVERQYQSNTPRQQSYAQFSFIIGFGANDSCLIDGAHSRHHVSLEEYSSNLQSMIQMIRSWPSNSDYNNCTNDNHNSIDTTMNVAVALLTPPPCDTEVQKASRDNENVTKLYAQECLRVGRELGVPVVDLWNGMQVLIDESGKEENDEKDGGWKEDYLSDGVHLTSLGNFRLYQLVVEMLDQTNDDDALGLGLEVTKLPRQYPDHSLVDSKHYEQTFKP